MVMLFAFENILSIDFLISIIKTFSLLYSHERREMNQKSQTSKHIHVKILSFPVIRMDFSNPISTSSISFRLYSHLTPIQIFFLLLF